jgi:hypothetical protein
MQEFLKALTVKDDAERYLSLFKSFWLAVWMAMDHIQWLQKVGYLKLVDLKKVDEWHSKGWFFGLMAGFIIAAYKLRAVLEENKAARAQLNDPSKLAAANKLLKAGDEKRNKQIMAMVKNGVDLVVRSCTDWMEEGLRVLHSDNCVLLAVLCFQIPAARLGWLPVSDGTVGLAGTITSCIGIYDTWPAAK